VQFVFILPACPLILTYSYGMNLTFVQLRIKPLSVNGRKKR